MFYHSAEILKICFFEKEFTPWFLKLFLWEMLWSSDVSVENKSKKPFKTKESLSLWNFWHCAAFYGKIFISKRVFALVFLMFQMGKEAEKFCLPHVSSEKNQEKTI